jgi:ribosomal protein S20
MKKGLILMLVAVFALSMLSGCGGSKGTSTTSPYNELMKMAQAIREAGGIADVGQGQSSREDIARQKAQNNGRQQLALALESKIQVLQKNFLEEIGSNMETEVNEAFSSVSKTMASTTLRGVFPEEERMVTKDGLITVYVLMAMDPATFNQSFLDELQSKPKVYERFRASQAYEELKSEMEAYEAQE